MPVARWAKKVVEPHQRIPSSCGPGTGDRSDAVDPVGRLREPCPLSAAHLHHPRAARDSAARKRTRLGRGDAAGSEGRVRRRPSRSASSNRWTPVSTAGARRSIIACRCSIRGSYRSGLAAARSAQANSRWITVVLTSSPAGSRGRCRVPDSLIVASGAGGCAAGVPCWRRDSRSDSRRTRAWPGRLSDHRDVSGQAAG